MATGKNKSTSASSKSLLRSQKRKQAVKRRQMRDTALSICLIGAAVCLYACFIAKSAAPLCLWVYETFFGLFGIGAYLFPAAMVFSGILLILRHRRILSKFGTAIVFIILFSAFVNVIVFNTDLYSGKNIAEYLEAFFRGGTDLSSGGVFGGILSVPLTLLAGKAVTGIIIFMLMLISLVFVTGLTFAKFIGTPEERKAARAEKRELEAEIVRIDAEAAEKTAEYTKSEKISASGTDECRTPKTGRIACRSRFHRKVYLVPDMTDGDVVKTINKISDPYLKDRTSAGSVSAAPSAGPTEHMTGSAVAELREDSGAEAGKRTSAVYSGIAADKKITSQDVAQAACEVENIIRSDAEKPQDEYIYPPVDLLSVGEIPDRKNIDTELHHVSEKLVETLRMFNVETHFVEASRGPAVTRYELSPEAGVRISRITNLADDIALNLAAKAVRIEAPIPGKAAIGIEVPNIEQETVNLRTVLDSEDFRRSRSKISAALGKDICGNNIIINIEKMPHLLVAGATGMGKSVCINSILISFLYKARPDEVKLILVDPKMVEFNVYRGIPHLLIPVVTDPKKAAGALSWAVVEMEARYEKLARKNVRDIYGYNKNLADGEKRMPHIVIVIDELADLMMASPKEVEESIIRLAQKARAAGMHLIIATQRPSSDVVTGLIKANIPSRIALAVSNGINSRIILDELGAEKLLGRGDMLYDPVGAVKPIRVQGCFISDKEVQAVTDFIKNNDKTAEKYDDAIMKSIEKLQQEQANPKSKSSHDLGTGDEGPAQDDEMLEKAIDTVVEMGQASTSMLQRRVGLGYARAARLIDVMEQRGYVGPYQGSKPREVLLSKEQWQEIKMNSGTSSVSVPDHIDPGDENSRDAACSDISESENIPLE